MRKRLSVVIITKNEETNLKECLKSVQWADEIIIVDNNSTDTTLKIAKRFTDKIFIHKENNLGLQKQYAIKKASKEWVLLLDADERVSKELKREIRNKILENNTTKYDAFSIKYQNHFLGKPVNFGGEKYRKVRLFKKGKGTVSPKPIHEEVIIYGKIGNLKGKIFHYSYRSLSQVLNKFKNYAEIIAQTKFKKQKSVSVIKLFFYPLHMFYARFIKEKGYKDGLTGLTLSFFFAYMEFLIYFYLALFNLQKKIHWPPPQTTTSCGGEGKKIR